MLNGQNRALVVDILLVGIYMHLMDIGVSIFHFSFCKWYVCTVDIKIFMRKLDATLYYIAGCMVCLSGFSAGLGIAI
jgi:hypothetical protein